MLTVRTWSSRSMPDDPSHVAIEDIFVVVVADLHHLVADAEDPAAHPTLGQPGPRRVERFLQEGVEVADAHRAPVHGAEHLDFFRLQTELAWDAFLTNSTTSVGGLLRIFFLKEEEVAGVTIIQHGHLPLVDAVGVDDDVAAFRLAEDDVEADNSRG